MFVLGSCGDLLTNIYVETQYCLLANADIKTHMKLSFCLGEGFEQAWIGVNRRRYC
jgi:hypothetical protein